MNISEVGLCFEAFAPVERQRRLQFWFSLNLRERVEASGRLAWLDPEGRVGGLRFLDLSARALRHLRAYLGANPGDRVEEPSTKLTALLAALEKHSPGMSSPEPQKALRAVALQEADSAASRWSQASTAGRIPRFDSVDRSRKEEMHGKGAVFFGALAAERALRQRPNKSEVRNTTVFHEANSGPRNFGNGSILERATEQPASDFPSSQDATGMVSLNWHLIDSRRQLKHGILLGALFSLIFTVAGGSYFRRKPSGSARGVSPAVAALPAMAPETQVSSGSSETRPTRTPRWPVSNSQAKPGSTSSATPEQLWAAVENGNTAAAVELADRFLQGDGVPVNCEQARVLLLVASKKNNADAARKLDKLHKTGCPRP